MKFNHTHLIYRITTGSLISDEKYDIAKTEKGFIIQCGNTYWQCDEHLSQTFWKNNTEETGDNYSAQREKNRINLEGIFQGKQIKKAYTIDDNPWTQCAHFSLILFAQSEKIETLYWFISPHDLRVYKIRAAKMQTESVTINHHPEKAQKVRIRPTGFEGNFWYGDYWFRVKDNLYVRYQAVHGPPGTPPTVKELISEKEGKND